MLSLVNNQPDWPLLSIMHIDQLPGIRWKLRNIGLLEKNYPNKFKQQADELARLLG